MHHLRSPDFASVIEPVSMEYKCKTSALILVRNLRGTNTLQKQMVAASRTNSAKKVNVQGAAGCPLHTHTSDIGTFTAKYPRSTAQIKAWTVLTIVNACA